MRKSLLAIAASVAVFAAAAIIYLLMTASLSGAGFSDEQAVVVPPGPTIDMRGFDSQSVPQNTTADNPAPRKLVPLPTRSSAGPPPTDSPSTSTPPSATASPKKPLPRKS